MLDFLNLCPPPEKVTALTGVCRLDLLFIFCVFQGIILFSLYKINPYLERLTISNENKNWIKLLWLISLQFGALFLSLWILEIKLI